jgi:hypothetical protein
MTNGPEPAPVDPEAELVGPQDQAEAIAEAYEEEAAMTSGPDDLASLSVKIRKIEERLATIEDYLGTPPSNARSLEGRIEELEADD